MALAKWSLDPAHSEVTFKVKHLMISTVTGQFNKFSLEAEATSDDFSSADKIEFSADIDSIDTNNPQRDVHLKSADFFHAEKNPQITFSGTKYEGKNGKIYGNLSMAGITKPVELDVEFGGVIGDSYGQTKAGFTVTGKISRKDFGITYNSVTEAGGVLLGDEIKINAEIQLVKQVEKEVAQPEMVGQE